MRLGLLSRVALTTCCLENPQPCPAVSPEPWWPLLVLATHGLCKMELTAVVRVAAVLQVLLLLMARCHLQAAEASIA